MVNAHGLARSGHHRVERAVGGELEGEADQHEAGEREDDSGVVAARRLPVEDVGAVAPRTADERERSEGEDEEPVAFEGWLEFLGAVSELLSPSVLQPGGPIPT